MKLCTATLSVLKDIAFIMALVVFWALGFRSLERDLAEMNKEDGN